LYSRLSAFAVSVLTMSSIQAEALAPTQTDSISTRPATRSGADTAIRAAMNPP